MAVDFIAGCLGGCAGVIVGHPFDTIKVHIQTQDHRNPLYKNTFDCFRKIIQKESVKGLYRGMTSPMTGVAFLNAIVFGVYGNVQRKLSEPESIYAHFMAGATAGLSQSIICSPMEMVKTRIQIQNNFKSAVKHKNPVDCLRHIWKHEGFRGVFRGVGLTAARDVPGFASYFVTFETMMRKNPDPSAFYTLMAGGMAGTFSWMISFPVDVVKSRLQADGIDGERKYRSTIDCIRKSYAAEGLSFFSRGIGSTLIRAFPMNAVCFLVVSYAMKMLDNATINVNMAPQPERLVLSDSYSYPFIMRIQRNYDPDYKYTFTKYLILLDGFHEATCHTEMIELADHLHGSLSCDTSLYYQIDDIDLSIRSEKDMIRNSTNSTDNNFTDDDENQRIPLLLSD